MNIAQRDINMTIMQDTYHDDSDSRIYCKNYFKNNLFTKSKIFYNCENRRIKYLILYKHNDIKIESYNDDEDNRLNYTMNFQDTVCFKKTMQSRNNNEINFVNCLKKIINYKIIYYHNNIDNNTKSIKKQNGFNDYKITFYTKTKKIERILFNYNQICKIMTCYESGRVYMIENFINNILLKRTMYKDNIDNSISCIEETDYNAHTLTIYSDYKKNIISCIAIYDNKVLNEGKIIEENFYDKNNQLINTVKYKKTNIENDKKDTQLKDEMKEGFIDKIINFFL